MAEKCSLEVSDLDDWLEFRALTLTYFPSCA